MADTRLADINFVPALFNDAVSLLTKERSQFFQSGIAVDMSDMVEFSRGGTTVTMPFLQDLTGADEVISDSSALTLNNITQDREVATVLERGKAWGVDDLAASAAGADIMGHIAGQVANYWNRRMNQVLISTLEGSFGAASMAGNVLDISGNVGAAAVFSGEAFVDAKFLLGDAYDDLSAVVVHSATLALMQKQNLIDFIPDSNGAPVLPTYMGHRVIVDDTLAPDAGTYTAYLFGAGTVGFARDASIVESETDRTALNGKDELITRRRFVMHPKGLRWIGTPAGNTPTNAELETGTNWIQAYPEDKQIGIVQFKFKHTA